MKKARLIIGIILMVIGSFILLLAAFTCFITINTHDATAAHYESMWQSFLVFLILGNVFLIPGILCVAIRKKKK